MPSSQHPHFGFPDVLELEDEELELEEDDELLLSELSELPELSEPELSDDDSDEELSLDESDSEDNELLDSDSEEEDELGGGGVSELPDDEELELSSGGISELDELDESGIVLERLRFVFLGNRNWLHHYGIVNENR